MKNKKKEPEPEIDYSLLTEGQKEELNRKPNYKAWAIFFGVLLVLMAVCVTAIAIISNQ